jgi:4-alpha-methyl-delta7-sterol-4alpha-methyl oxidase
LDLQAALALLIELTPGGAWVFFGLSCAAVQTLVVVGSLGFFHLAERTGWFERWRFASDRPVSATLRAMARKELARGLMVVPVVYLLAWPLFALAGGRMVAPLPSVFEVLWQLALFIFVQDTIFYWSHRLLHHPWWFRKVHAKHHRFSGTRAEAFGFAHPAETAANTVALLAGPMLVSTHVFTLWLWLILRLVETVDAHSGFLFPTSPWSAKHCWHHRYHNGCYGSFFGFWDWVMGTDKGYRAWKAEQRSTAASASE